MVASPHVQSGTPSRLLRFDHVLHPQVLRQSFRSVLITATTHHSDFSVCGGHIISPGYLGNDRDGTLPVSYLPIWGQCRRLHLLQHCRLPPRPHTPSPYPTYCRRGRRWLARRRTCCKCLVTDRCWICKVVSALEVTAFEGQTGRHDDSNANCRHMNSVLIITFVWTCTQRSSTSVEPTWVKFRPPCVPELRHAASYTFQKNPDRLTQIWYVKW